MVGLGVDLEVAKIDFEFEPETGVVQVDLGFEAEFGIVTGIVTVTELVELVAGTQIEAVAVTMIETVIVTMVETQWEIWMRSLA